MSARNSVSELARRLARNAEAACRHYLPKGRREGNYWLVGDTFGTPGRSLYLRLKGPDRGPGAAGRWTDGATGEFGDLVDLIALNRNLAHVRDALDEAREFLNLPHLAPACTDNSSRPFQSSSPQAKIEAAKRLFAASKPIAGTLAESYLRGRGIVALPGCEALRFHPRCFYRDFEANRTFERPAMIAAVTDLAGAITGVHRTFLDADGGKASVPTPRRAMGRLLGNGVRFGRASETSPILIAGEGIETILSLRLAMPDAPAIAALSANHLAAILFPSPLQRLYVAVDGDAAGRRAADKLSARGRCAGVEVLRLLPTLGDFNDDLRNLGLAALREGLRAQLLQEDSDRYLSMA